MAQAAADHGDGRGFALVVEDDAIGFGDGHGVEDQEVIRVLEGERRQVARAREHAAAKRRVRRPAAVGRKRHTSAPVVAISRLAPPLIELVVVTAAALKGPDAISADQRRLGRGFRRARRGDELIVEIADDSVRKSRLNSSAKRRVIVRRARNDTANPVESRPRAVSAESSGVTRAPRPSAALAPFRIVAPSPKSHDDVCRLGKIGVDVAIGAPGPGSAVVPLVSDPVPMPAAPSISQARYRAIG